MAWRSLQRERADLPVRSMAVPVGAAVALARDVNHGEDYPQNGREVYSDENVVENHIDRLSVTVSSRSGRYDFGSGCWSLAPLSSPASFTTIS